MVRIPKQMSRPRLLEDYCGEVPVASELDDFIRR